MAKSNFIYRVSKKIAKLLGYNLILTKESKENNSYTLIIPLATYSPWLTDASFKESYAIAKKYTMVDEYRCYELWQLVEQTSGLTGALIEIGVWRGGSGALIAKKASLCNIKNKIYLCDTFKGVVKAGANDSKYKGGEHADTSKEIVEEIIRKLKLENTKILTGIFPEETGALISDTAFRFCHIDVDVYESAKEILEWVWPKLVVGGIVVFDDYGFITCDGITRFVNEERNKNDRIVFHNLNGHAVLIKTKE